MSEGSHFAPNAFFEGSHTMQMNSKHFDVEMSGFGSDSGSEMGGAPKQTAKQSAKKKEADSGSELSDAALPQEETSPEDAAGAGEGLDAQILNAVDDAQKEDASAFGSDHEVDVAGAQPDEAKQLSDEEEEEDEEVGPST